MAVQAKTIDALVKNIKCVCNDKIGKFASQPNLLKDINFSNVKLAPLEKDTIKLSQSNTLHFEKSEINELKEKEFTPFFETLKKKFKRDTNFGYEIKEKISVDDNGYFNSVTTNVEIPEKILTDPTFSRIAYKGTGETLNFPQNENFPNAKLIPINTKKELDNFIKAIGGEEVFETKTLTKEQRIGFVKSHMIHELSHGVDIEDIIKLEGVGIKNYVNKIIYSKLSKSRVKNVSDLDEIASQMKKSWENLKEKENTIKQSSPHGKKIKKIWDGIQLRANSSMEELPLQETYYTSPTEIKAFMTQYQLSKTMNLPIFN